MVVKNDPWPIGEPSRLTHEDVGRLCAAWSFLEYVTEQTLWGILDIKPDNKLGPLISWRLDMRGRWQLIIDQAESKHTKEDQATLRDINKKISDATRDRNIIVHGIIHGAWAKVDTQTDAREIVPCWTVFRGAGALKAYPVSFRATQTVRENIQAIAKLVQEFNVKHGYQAATDLKATTLVPPGEWPVRLE